MVRARGMLYKVVAHKVLLNGSESWVVTEAMLKVLEGFHHRAARRIAGMTDHHVEDGEWGYLPVVDVMEAVGLWTIREYIQRWQSTIAAQGARHKIYEMCTGEERKPGYGRKCSLNLTL